MDSPSYELVIRTPAAQARADRIRWVKRSGIAAGLILAILTPGTVEHIAPTFCSHVWMC